MTSRFLLDTPLLAALLNRRPRAVDLITPWIEAGQATTSILCYGEVVEYMQGRVVGQFECGESVVD